MADGLSPNFSILQTTCLVILLLFLTFGPSVSNANAQDDTGTNICVQNITRVHAQNTGWAPEDYPDPIKTPKLCGRVNKTASFVCDPDRILTRADERREAAALKLFTAMIKPEHPLHDLVPPQRSTATADYLDLLMFTTLRDTPCPCDSCPGKNNGYNIAIALMKKMATSGTAAALHNCVLPKGYKMEMGTPLRSGKSTGDLLLLSRGFTCVSGTVQTLHPGRL
ncbi:hypothetical protein Bbelb_061740 [Branchiostoma belcheri]|nr:hypothetical protein Bbelb_061740 [Branchiostoma belcheri]